MVTDGDLVAALLLALLILVVALCVWPGYARVRARGLAGHWVADSSGATTAFEIRARARAPGGARAFEVIAQAGAGPSTPLRGRVTGVRGLRLADGRKGRVEMGGRRIIWAGGHGSWTRQGV